MGRVVLSIPGVHLMRIESLEYAGPSSVLAENKFSMPSVEDNEAFWLQELANPPQILEMPLDFPRQAIRSSGIGQSELTIDEDLRNALESLAKQYHCELPVLLCSVWGVLLHRLSNQSDLAIGVPLGVVHDTNNHLPSFVPLRSRIGDETRFADYLQTMQSQFLQMAKHHAVSLEEVYAKLGRDTESTQAPMFLAAIDYRVTQGGELDDWPEAIRNLRMSDAFGLDLFLRISICENNLITQCNFSSELFALETVQRWLNHFKTLLVSVVDDASKEVVRLPILGESERKKMLDEWNATEHEYPKDIRCLHQFFERQVERTPDRIALVLDGKRMTYEELNRRSNRLAHYLRKQGVGPGKVVALLVERSMEMVIGILGTLKAGGAYLPLDPAYPEERIAFVLEDAQPHVLLHRDNKAVETGKQEANGSPLDLRKVTLNDAYVDEPEENPVTEISPRDNVYIIYTSGSTGKPKGAINSHAGVVNWLHWMLELYPMTEGDAMMFKAPFTFDVSVREFFLPLASGARVVLARPGMHGDSRYLISTVRSERVTVLHFVPPMLGAFLDDPDASRCDSLRLVMCSGDALSYELQQRFFDTFKHLDLHNMWGATEHAPESSYYVCRREELGCRGIVPIGKPGANTQLYILDRWMQPVPIGVTGEVYIGGIQTGLGYLARPELTAAKFLENPFVENQVPSDANALNSNRLYRTGDLGRFRPDGVAEFIGRIDHQVKLRGFRIELGEIESVLKKHSAIHECVAIVRGREESNKRLVAYLVGDQVSVAELRVHAAKSLPDYMVPVAFVYLEKIPVTANGKLDRAALPEPLITAQNSVVSPEGEVETQIKNIWEETLGISPISVEANFFEMGGSSLNALRIFTRINHEIGTHLPLAILLKNPTIRALSQSVQNGEESVQDDGPTWRPIVTLQPDNGSGRTPFFGVHGRDGNILFYRKIAELLGKDQPFYAIQSQGLDGSKIEHKTVTDIARYYLTEMKKVQPYGPYIVGGFSFGGVCALEIAQLLRQQGDEVAMVAMFDTYNPAKAPKLISVADRIRHRLRERDALSINRILQFLARRTRGKTADYLLRWNEYIHRFKMNRNALALSGIIDNANLHIRMIHERAFLSFQPRPFDGGIALFRPLTDLPGYKYDKDLGWGSIAKGGVEVHAIPGTHDTIFSNENAPFLAKALGNVLVQGLKTGHVST
jgi:amino acid adenylation domain-containing protein